MISYAAPQVEHDTPQSGQTSMFLRVWGVSTADQEHAIRRAGQGQSRNMWRFVQTERLIGARCPINVRDPDPKAIAADAGYDWAYIVYPADGTR